MQLSVQVYNANHRGLSLQTSALRILYLLVRMTVLILFTEVSLVHLINTLLLLERTHLERIADALRHEPCGLLGDADVARQLKAADALLVGGQDIDGNEPLLKRDGAVLEDSSLDGGELFAALGALESFVCALQFVYPVMLTEGAAHVAAPPDVGEIVNACLLVREIFGNLKQVGELAHTGTISKMGDEIKFG